MKKLIAAVKEIIIANVITAGYDPNPVATGICPNCKRMHTHIFTKGDAHILACPACGLRIYAPADDQYWCDYLDSVINILKKRRSTIKLPLPKKAITQQIASLRLLYY